MAVRYKRGDKHPSDAQLFFWRYHRGEEVWISDDELKRRVNNAITKDKLWKKTSVGRECARRCATRANIKHSEYRASYYKRADVREKYRAKHNSKPEVIAKREARLKFRMERAAYRESDEFKAILKERLAKSYQKRKAQGKTREYDRRKWHSDVQHRLGQNMRRLIHSALTRSLGAIRSGRTFELIGCSPRALAVHLEAQFKPEMSWENYGTYWEVDHALPLKMFDLRDPVQQRQAFFFENLQPLEVPANRKKSDKVEGVSVRKVIPFRKTA